MSFAGILDALSDNVVIRSGGKFDFVDFDACVMGGFELTLAIADYADFYIASPELEPGYGQDYEGWLNSVGADPDMGTYEVGKQIVDDFVAFYDKEQGDGATQEGTLAVIDEQKLLASDFVPAMAELERMLEESAKSPWSDGEYHYYDVLSSIRGALQYGHMGYYDLGDFVGQAAVAMYDVKQDATPGHVNDSPYIAVAKRIMDVLEDPAVINGRGSKGIVTSGDRFYRDTDGALHYEPLRTSGIYLFFPRADTLSEAAKYAKRMAEALATMQESDHKELLKSYRDTMIDYSLLLACGHAVSSAADAGAAKSAITYDVLKARWQAGAMFGTSEWDSVVLPLIEARYGSEAAARQWLDKVIAQQVADVIERSNISGKKVLLADGTGYKATFTDTAKRFFDQVVINVLAELPGVEAFLDAHPDYKQITDYLPGALAFKIGAVEGARNLEDLESSGTGDDALARDLVNWLTNTTSGWDFGAVPAAQWYAVQDAGGTLHAAQVDMHDDGAIVYAAQIDPETNRPKAMYLAFPKEGDEYVLSEYAYVSLTEPLRPVVISELKQPLEGVYMAQQVTVLGIPLFIPMSVEPLTITAENGSQTKLVFTDVANIPDIRSTSLQMVVRDIYAYETDITDQVLSATEEVVDVGLLDVPSATYNGHELAPKVYYQGELLTQGRDYEWLKLDSSDGFADAGDHEVALAGIGRFANLGRKTFTITPADIADAVVSGIEDKPYTGSAVTQSPMLTFGDMTLVEGRDYTVSYADNVEAGQATVTITGVGNFTGSVTKTFAITEAATYAVVSGDGSAWTKGSSDALAFTVKRSEADDETYRRFAGIEIDGKAVDASGYGAEAGSLVLKLKPSLLGTLSVGEHELTVRFDDGTARAKFTVRSATSSVSPSPKTGDQLAILGIVLAAVAAIALACAVRARRALR